MPSSGFPEQRVLRLGRNPFRCLLLKGRIASRNPARREAFLPPPARCMVFLNIIPDLDTILFFRKSNRHIQPSSHR